jgi:hypothetical protein
MSAIIMTFEQQYDDVSANPLGKTDEEIQEDYWVIYSTWRLEDTPPTIEELEDEILTDFIAPIGASGVMVAAEGSKTGQRKLTHGYERYPGVPGKAHQDRRTDFALEGGAWQDTYTFAMDKHQLGLAPYVNVPHMLSQHLSILKVPPPRSWWALSRQLLGQDFAARKAYLLTYPILEDLDLLEVCIPLLEYLQVASKQPTASNNRPPMLQDRLGLANYLIRPAVVSQHHTSILYHLLPELRPSDTGRLPDSFAESLSDGLTNISTEMHADHWSRETRVSEAIRRKTFRERHDDRIANEILPIASSVDDDFIPAVYQELGGKS